MTSLARSDYQETRAFFSRASQLRFARAGTGGMTRRVPASTTVGVTMSTPPTAPDAVIAAARARAA